jgi:glycosyltransferase involved in cell wall biosynthesis
VLAKDFVTLPLAIRVAGDAPVLHDAHEYAPREFEDRWLWRLLFGPFVRNVCNRYLPRTRAVTTVSQRIAEEYRLRFGINPLVVRNAPPYQHCRPRTTDPARIRLFHHGAANPSRRLELMIEAFREVDERFELHFMLVPSHPKYLARLIRLAAGVDRVFFHEPVPMEDIVTTANQYDVGVYLLPPRSFNSRYALPNKLFEFIQARLGIVIGPSPEMADIVTRSQNGLVAEDFSPAALARAINSLTAQKVDGFKHASDAVSRDLCAEREQVTWLRLVDELLHGAPA